MALKTSFVVQPFELRRERLRPARQEPAQSEFGALKNAEALAARLPGAAALKVVADDETCRTTSPRACSAAEPAADRRPLPSMRHTQRMFIGGSKLRRNNGS